MTHKQEREMWLKRLKRTKANAASGHWTHADDRNIVSILEMLIKKAYERDIKSEEMDKLHDQIMGEMDWTDFQ